MALAALLLVSAPYSTSRATISPSDGVSSAGAISGIERSRQLALDFRRVLSASNNYALSGDSSAVVEKIAIWTAAPCAAGDCAATTMVVNPVSDGLAAPVGVTESASLRAGTRDGSSMTAADLVLMCLFAAALIGYQLARKQRELRSSALFTATA